MTVLGIETTTDVCSVGLADGERTWVRSVRENRVHAEKLLVLAGEVLAEAGKKRTDVRGVAVSAGPGSFTGLRIGASAAKGLVAAWGCAFAAVSTFEAIVHAVREGLGDAGGLMIALDAKQGEWYSYTTDADGAEEFSGLLPLASVRSRLKGRILITDAPGTFEGLARRAEDVRGYCRGDVVAELGRQAIDAERPADAAAFEPVYLKQFITRTMPRPTAPRPASDKE